MTSSEVFRRIIAGLDAAQIPYMVTGSFASSFHGTPRTTQDIDIVVFPTSAQLSVFVRSLPDSDYYVSEPAALEALERRGQFNVIELNSGWKVDFIVRKDRVFSRTEFERRKVVQFVGIPFAVASAEDTIIAKLEWSKLGESERQREDAVAMLTVRALELDMAYIRRWVEELDLVEIWNSACQRAGISS